MIEERMHRRELRESRSLRAVVKQMLASGHSLSRIAKDTGKTYTHIKQIALQEQDTPDAAR